MAKKQQPKKLEPIVDTKKSEARYNIVVQNFGMSLVNFNAKIGSTRYSKNIPYMDKLTIELGMPEKEVDSVIDAIRAKSSFINVKITRELWQHTRH